MTHETKNILYIMLSTSSYIDKQFKIFFLVEADKAQNDTTLSNSGELTLDAVPGIFYQILNIYIS